MQEDSFTRGSRLLARLIVRAYVQRMALPPNDLNVANSAANAAADQKPAASYGAVGTGRGEPPIVEASADGVLSSRGCIAPVASQFNSDGH